MKDMLHEIFNISGKCVLVTGAAGFFGRYIARTFLEVGAKVVLLSRSPALHEQVKDYDGEFGEGAAVGRQVDFYDRDALRETLSDICQNHDVDVLVNNAYDMGARTGFNTPTGRLETSTYEQWLSAFEAGTYWAVLTTQILGEQFRQKKSGSIINVSSMYGVVAPNPVLYAGTEFFNPPSYGVNKAGLIAFTRYTASFWGRDGVRCNAIVPGPFPNRESETENSVGENGDFVGRLEDRTALGRVGHPNDLRGILICLASDASSFITGQAIAIDGGWTIT